VAGTLKNASVLSLSLNSFDGFVGMGAVLTINDPTTISDDTIDTSSAIGFSLSAAWATLVTVRPAGAGAGDQTSFSGLDASLADAQLVGVDGLDLFASGTVKLNVARASDGSDAGETLRDCWSRIPGVSTLRWLRCR
jgi:hypothetical protein